MMRPLVIAAALVAMASPSLGDTVRDRSGKVTGTIDRQGEGFMIRDRQGRVTDRIDCSASGCLGRELRTGKTSVIIRKSTQDRRGKVDHE